MYNIQSPPTCPSPPMLHLYIIYHPLSLFLSLPLLHYPYIPSVSLYFPINLSILCPPSLSFPLSLWLPSTPDIFPTSKWSKPISTSLPLYLSLSHSLSLPLPMLLLSTLSLTIFAPLQHHLISLNLCILSDFKTDLYI